MNKAQNRVDLALPIVCVCVLVFCLFIYLVIQQIFIELLLSAWLCSENWSYNSKQNKMQDTDFIS